MPKVSVIICVYNAEKYIEKCARSLFGQTLGDVEYVFVDDCTPDRSMEVLQQVLEEYPERKGLVKIIHNEQNMGQAKARSIGLAAATGDYITHCDSDDWVDTMMYEKLYTKAVAEDLDMVWCDFCHVQPTGNHVDRKPLVGDLKEDGSDVFIRSLLLNRVMGPLWNRLVKASIVNTALKYPPAVNMIEDVTMLIQYAYACKRFGYIAEPLYYYRCDGESSAVSDRSLLWIAKEMDKNLEVITRFFADVCPGRYDKELEWRRFFNKRWVTPMIHTPKDCRIWLDEHPELNTRLFFNPYIHWHDKLVALTIMLRVYPIVHPLLHK